MTIVPETAHDQTLHFIDNNSTEAAAAYLISDRTRTATRQGVFFSLLVAFLISGCAAAYSPAPLPINHPANPAAPETSPPPPSQALRSEGAPLASVEEAVMQAPHARHHMEHGGHE